MPLSVAELSPLVEYHIELLNDPKKADIEIVTQGETWESFSSQWVQYVTMFFCYRSLMYRLCDAEGYVISQLYHLLSFADRTSRWVAPEQAGLAEQTQPLRRETERSAEEKDYAEASQTGRRVFISLELK